MTFAGPGARDLPSPRLQRRLGAQQAISRQGPICRPREWAASGFEGAMPCRAENLAAAGLSLPAAALAEMSSGGHQHPVGRRDLRASSGSPWSGSAAHLPVSRDAACGLSVTGTRRCLAWAGTPGTVHRRQLREARAVALHPSTIAQSHDRVPGSGIFRGFHPRSHVAAVYRQRRMTRLRSYLG